MGLVAGFLLVLLREIQYRQRKKADSINPPPPDAAVCKRCFFFRKFADGDGRSENLGDTQLIRVYRFDDGGHNA
jgi:hypothetical protein